MLAGFVAVSHHSTIGWFGLRSRHKILAVKPIGSDRKQRLSIVFVPPKVQIYPFG
jgi:hypothetical protein